MNHPLNCRCAECLAALPEATQDEADASWQASLALARRSRLRRIIKSTLSYLRVLVWCTPLKDWKDTIRCAIPTITFTIKGQEIARTCSDREEFGAKLRAYYETFNPANR